ncbi:MAG: hydroxymethylbilane synthase [Methylobacteriaceae bacterium]|jgi:hydroxymethylbilane synthase|nr:hydroxymethylbilane synthase [Methylobacteriaceae bacterium]
MILHRTLSIGTRGSPLALAQAREVQEALAAALDCAVEHLPLTVVRTGGDIIQDRPLAEAGGKGLFTRELDEALLAGHIDIAVHSAKDVPTRLADGLVLAGCLTREDPRDAFISLRSPSLQQLPAGASVGTASLRRSALVRAVRPDIRVVLLRGNIETRLKRLTDGVVDATLLAMAGLNRMGYQRHVTRRLEPEVFLPAVGQGAIAVCARRGDDTVWAALAHIVDPVTSQAVAMERAFLDALDGSCRMPIAGYARPTETGFRFSGMVLRPDGSDSLSVERACGPAEATACGRAAGEALRAELPAGFLD